MEDVDITGAGISSWVTGVLLTKLGTVQRVQHRFVWNLKDDDDQGGSVIVKMIKSSHDFGYETLRVHGNACGDQLSSTQHHRQI